MESMLIMFVVLAAVMFVTSRATRKRQMAQKQQTEERLVPGAWVMTSSGFYGRFVERDGDVVVLETNDGTETFWTHLAVREVVDAPPFAVEQPAPAEEATDTTVEEARTEAAQMKSDVATGDDAPAEDGPHTQHS